MALIELQRAGAPSFSLDLSAHGDRPALVWAGGSLTYSELERRVQAGATRLGTNRRLILLPVDNSADALVNYLAALRGGHPVLLTAAGDEAAMARLVASYDPDVVLSPAAGLQERRLATAHDLHPDLAVLLSTSGSTGSPKLVRLSHRNLEANASAIAQYLELTPADRAITTLPLQYSYGLSVINSHLHVGATLVLTDLSVVDRCFWNLFRRAGATSFAGVPHTFDLLDRVGFDRMSLPTLRYVTQAGGKMRPEQIRRYAALGQERGWDFFVMYGQTEATARMAYLPPHLAAAHSHTIGRAIPGGSFSIEDAGDSGVGELVYRGDNVMLGYAETPTDLADGPTLTELRTGDLARVTADGLYEVVGRKSRFIKVYGLRIDLDSVETLLSRHGIGAACTGDDTGLVVAVERSEDVDPTVGVVTREVGLRTSDVRVVVADPVPRLPSGKPDYVALLQSVGDPVDPHAYGRPAPRDPGEAVRAVFVDVLGVEPEPEDTFVSLGGDSLSYVEMSMGLEEVLGTLPRDWHTLPVKQLVPNIRRRGWLARTDTSAVVRAAAIVLIVGTHAKLWQLTGGAHALLVVAGFNFARFQLRAKSALASVARIALPSMCWIAAVASVSEKYGWPNVFFVNGLVGRPGDHWGYWFLEALIQILLVLTAVLAVPAVSRLEIRRPMAVPLAAVGVGLLFRFDVVELSNTFPISRPHEVFWLFALGWAAARASSWRGRAVVTCIALAALPGFFDTAGRGLIVLASLALVLWLPSVPLVRPMQRLVGPLAGASLYIYLTHFQVYPPLQRLSGPVLAVAGSLVVGVVAWLIGRWLVESPIRYLASARARGGPRGGRRARCMSSGVHG